MNFASPRFRNSSKRPTISKEILLQELALSVLRTRIDLLAFEARPMNGIGALSFKALSKDSALVLWITAGAQTKFLDNSGAMRAVRQYNTKCIIIRWCFDLTCSAVNSASVSSQLQIQIMCICSASDHRRAF